MDEREELEIKKLMGKVVMKKVPDELLNNYESEVMRKIKAAPGMPYGLMFSVAAVFAVGMVLGTWLFIAKVQPAKQTVPVKEEAVYKEPMPAVVPIIQPKAAVTQPDVISSSEDAAEFTQVANDLFILEMLGEDDGILDNMDRIATDIEMGSQMGRPAGF